MNSQTIPQNSHKNFGINISMDLHTHTCASGHGTTDTITDMAKEAAKRGVTLLGISDHGPASTGSAGLSYFRGLHLWEKQRFGIRLLYGAEANILDREGRLDIPDDVLQTLDFCIVSMHRPIYASGSAQENTTAYIRAFSHPNVRIIGHCDDSRFPVDYRALVRACLEQKVFPELNNVSLLPDSYRKNCRSNAIRLLDACRRLDCPVLLSSDSHGRQAIGNIAAAAALITELDFPQNLILQKGLPQP